MPKKILDSLELFRMPINCIIWIKVLLNSGETAMQLSLQVYMNKPSGLGEQYSANE